VVLACPSDATLLALVDRCVPAGAVS